ncbi:hypothetical protein [uncultured Enterovirga sp.]|uniref:hypothetical protein n=1 Tax=uncultured Enterovirga sp. TaxID=2026352 RepID=UPI0035CC43DF
MAVFVCRLIPPRPDFAFTMSPAEAEDEAAARASTEADPAIRTGLGLRYETSPMLQAALHPSLVRIHRTTGT